MFIGTNTVNMDAKGRIAIPAKQRASFHDACANQIVITIDLLEPCLVIYPIKQWEKLLEKLAGFSTTNKNHTRIKRLLISHASEHQIDSHGRVLLPPVLRKHAGLDKQVVLSGLDQTIQIWSEESWNEQIQEDIAALNEGPLTSEELPELIL